VQIHPVFWLTAVAALSKRCM